LICIEEEAGLVADLETRVFDPAGHPVVGAGAAEGEEVTAGLQDAQALTRPELAPRLEGTVRSDRQVVLPCRLRQRFPRLRPFGAVLLGWLGLAGARSHLRLDRSAVPNRAHEANSIWRVRADRVDRAVLEGAHLLHAVAGEDPPCHTATRSRSTSRRPIHPATFTVTASPQAA